MAKPTKEQALQFAIMLSSGVPSRVAVAPRRVDEE